MGGHKTKFYLLLVSWVGSFLVLLPRLWLSGQSNTVLIQIIPLIQTAQPLSLTELLPDARTRLSRIAARAENSGVLMWALDATLSRVQSPHTRATVCLLLGQPQAVEAAMAGARDDPRSRLLLAFAYAQQGEFDDAHDVIHLVPGVGAYLVRASGFEQAKGNQSESMQLLEMAVNIGRPEEIGLPELYRTLSLNSYYVLHDWDKAVEWAEQWVEMTNADVYAVDWLAHLYLQQGQPEAAFEAWQRVDSAIAGQLASYWKDMGQVYQSRGDWNTAIEMYRQAWQRSDNKLSGLREYIAWYLGAALVHTGRVDEAVPYLEVATGSQDEPLRRAATQLLVKLGFTKR
jgi:tetratricopeptide (TPR) repeat protein